MRTLSKLFAVLILGGVSCGAHASLITLDLSSGWYSYDHLDGRKNVVIVINLNAISGMASGAPVEIDGIGWDLNVTTIGPSWLSEAALDFDNGSLTLIPGAGVDASGEQFFSSGGVLFLADLGLANIFLQDGLLTLQFFETFDDTPLELDAILSGTVTLSTVMAPVPLPAAVWFFASGLLATGVIGRSQRRVA